ncbi:COP9 signalosome complex subunit 7 [Cyclospora cayetanensis]|uniref:Uncharacterized protein n=2 Tax=Cyclospora cayetanensis TaxID=88456 RepID=A0A1D3DAI6_9EIME|nr:COP9 signalosome complex subunit 7 [Cyclospora cayetanensis]OEH80451.1 hypothetical protein cyc_03162 [Cyclospora cayetanensis]
MCEDFTDASMGALWGPCRRHLDSLVARARQAKGASLMQIIEEALVHPEVFVFGELLELENVQQLGASRNEEVAAEGGVLEGGPRALFLLRLMASGTVRDLVERREALLGAPIPPAILFKLRLLTVASLASVSPHLAFSEIQEALAAPGCCEPAGASAECSQVDLEIEGRCEVLDRWSSTPAATKAWLTELEVEELVLTCMRLGLVHGRIDGELGCLDSCGALNRDPTERDIPAMIGLLKDFSGRLSEIICHLRTAKDAIEHHAIDHLGKAGS